MVSESHTTSLRSRIGRLALWVGAGSFVLIILLLLSSYAESFVGWTGLSTREVRDSGGELVAYYPAKTFWDWLELLLVPAVLAIGGFLFTRTENRQTRDIEEKRLAESQRIEQVRTQEAVLKDYLDQMTDLLFSHKLRESSEDDEVRNLARARTLTALRRVDGERKATIVQFLYESQLVGGVNEGRAFSAIVQLEGGNLSGVNLAKAHLAGIELTGAKLEEAQLGSANLTKAKLERVDLSQAKLFRANLTEAQLEETNFTGAKLPGANLTRATLLKTDLTEAVLNGAILEGATLKQVRLHGATLSWANLNKTRLEHNLFGCANLTGVRFDEAIITDGLLSMINLNGAHFEGAMLRDAMFSGANLEAARFTAANLEGAHFSEAYLRHANLKRANLTRATLYDANLDGANLEAANLEGAILEGTILSRCHSLTRDQLLKANSLHGARLPKHINPADLGDLWSPQRLKNLRKQYSTTVKSLTRINQSIRDIYHRIF